MKVTRPVDLKRIESIALRSKACDGIPSRFLSLSQPELPEGGHVRVFSDRAMASQPHFAA
jgi:hypothetical protein